LPDLFVDQQVCVMGSVAGLDYRHLFVSPPAPALAIALARNRRK
jgi:hypothetical protein